MTPIYPQSCSASAWREVAWEIGMGQSFIVQIPIGPRGSRPDLLDNQLPSHRQGDPGSVVVMAVAHLPGIVSVIIPFSLIK